ncbi:MAG: hypothetical protein E7082_05635 [Bacteroidales bacterium]|nr:hypothetical protein [Bacteroidales bacterium]
MNKIIPILIMTLMTVNVTAHARSTRNKKPTAEELIEQVNEAFNGYNTDLAKEKIAELRKLKKGVTVETIDSIEQRVERMSEMIQRVEDIIVIDSLTLNRDDFFRHYRMASSAGVLASPEEVGAEKAADSTVVYLTQDCNLMIWGGTDGLMQARKFTDGSWEEPTMLSDILNHGGTANFPFLLSDGITLYYATDGEDSLGGLDIYMTRNDREDYASPLNLGMPYNSPYDDYMLAIDEETGIGWFATDRNKLGDLITVYVFIPNAVRININVDDKNLSNRAKLASIAETHRPNEDYTAILHKIANISDVAQSNDEPDFIFAFPNGKVYTRWSDFKSPQARRLMEAYIDAQNEANADSHRLEELRMNFKQDDSNTANAILSLEKKIKQAPITLKRMANQVISIEMK